MASSSITNVSGSTQPGETSFFQDGRDQHTTSRSTTTAQQSLALANEQSTLLPHLGALSELRELTLMPGVRLQAPSAELTSLPSQSLDELDPAPADPVGQGKWRSIYFGQGAAAAIEYSAIVVQKYTSLGEGIKGLSERIPADMGTYYATPKQAFQRSEDDLINYCNKKITKNGEGKYEDEVEINDGRPRKARPGVTPFHLPSFRHRYFYQDERDNFLHWKCQDYKINLEHIRFFLDSLPPTDPAIPHLKELQKIFQIALDKWSQRKAAADQNPDLYLLSPPKEPLDLMGFRFLQEELGLLGEGASAAVVEDASRLDTEHYFLKGRVVVPSGQTTSDKEHATAICGIIAQTAPKALQYVSLSYGMFRNIPLHDREIVNCSFNFPPIHLGGAPNKTKLVDGFYEIDKIRRKILPSAYEKTFSDGKLLIWALGNESLLFDESSAPLRAYFSCKTMYNDKSIYVVNLQRNGLTPCPSTNFSGEEFAENTVCSVGEGVITTMKGNTWGPGGGTSCAAPFVTGLALLLRANFPRLNPQEIREAILEGATPILIDDEGNPFEVLPEDLKNYPIEQVKQSQRIFGRGRIDGKRSYQIAQSMNEEAQKHQQDGSSCQIQ